MNQYLRRGYGQLYETILGISVGRILPFGELVV